MRGICRGDGVSVIEEIGLHSWAVGAHELGHRYATVIQYLLS